MAIHFCAHPTCERERFDEELAAKHYLKNANAVGRVLRYVAEYRGQWVPLLVFSSAAFHIRLHLVRRGGHGGVSGDPLAHPTPSSPSGLCH
ncbi:MAG: hypothetical protein ABSH34_12765 [Verrucomicrobiota bacterium]|jgi:hypothetical protein